MCMLLTCVRRDDCKPCATKVCHLRLRACTRDAPAMRGAQWQSIPVGAMCRGGARLIMPFHTATTPQAHTATRHTRPYPRPAAQTGVAVTRESWRLEVEPVLPSRSRPALYVQTTVALLLGIQDSSDESSDPRDAMSASQCEVSGARRGAPVSVIRCCVVVDRAVIHSIHLSY